MRSIHFVDRAPLAEQMQLLVRDYVMYIPLITWDQADALSPKFNDAGIYAEHGTFWFNPMTIWKSQ